MNPKVIGVLLLAGAVVWFVAPGAGVGAVPLLLGLICPASMGVMMWQLRPRRDAGPTSTPAAPAPTTAESFDAELRAVREELAIARARRQLRDNQPTG